MLAAAGIGRAEANRCKQVAKIAHGEFEQYIEDRRANGTPMSASDVVKTVARKASRNAVMQRETLPDLLHTGDLAELAGQESEHISVRMHPGK